MRGSRLLPIVLVLAAAGCGSTATKTVTKTIPGSTGGTTATTPTTTATTPTTTPTTQPATTSTAAQPTQPVYFQGVVGGAAVRPGTLELTGDGTLSVEQVQWSSWGGPVASGSGNALYHGCTPNCAAAPTHAAVVSIRLSEVRTCRGRRYYAGLALRLTSGRLLDRNFVQRSWSPC